MAVRSSGFTLVEVLLSVGLSALLLVTVYWTYFSINRSIEVASENHETLETGRVALELLKKDIRGAVTGKDFVCRRDNPDGMAASEIDFTTTAGTGRRTTLLFARIAYGLVRNNNGDKFFIRKEFIEDKKAGQEREFTSELSRAVVSFEILCYNGSEWVDRWEGRSALPKQVRIIIGISDARGQTRTFTADETIGTGP